jgi:hypothetical protein
LRLFIASAAAAFREVLMPQFWSTREFSESSNYGQLTAAVDITNLLRVIGTFYSNKDEIWNLIIGCDSRSSLAKIEIQW